MSKLSHRRWHRLPEGESLLYGLIAVLLVLFTGCVFNLGSSGVRGLENFKMAGVGSIEATGIQGKRLAIALTGVWNMTIEGRC